MEIAADDVMGLALDRGRISPDRAQVGGFVGVAAGFVCGPFFPACSAVFGTVGAVGGVVVGAGTGAIVASANATSTTVTTIEGALVEAIADHDPVCQIVDVPKLRRLARGEMTSPRGGSADEFGMMHCLPIGLYTIAFLREYAQSTTTSRAGGRRRRRHQAAPSSD